MLVVVVGPAVVGLAVAILVGGSQINHARCSRAKDRFAENLKICAD